MLAFLGGITEELEYIGKTYYLYVLLFSIYSECAVRGVALEYLLKAKHFSLFRATIIASIMYIMLVFGNNRPYTFIDRSTLLFLYLN